MRNYSVDYAGGIEDGLTNDTNVTQNIDVLYAYPLEFVILLCIVFTIEIVAGLAMNLYNIYHWYNRIVRRFSFENMSGHNFVINLKFLDVFICSVIIPFALIIQVVQPQYNLVPCLLKEGLIILASGSTFFGVLLVSVDRYAAVVTPLEHVITPFRKNVCRIGLVVYGVAGSVLPLLCFTVGSYKTGFFEINKYKSCRHVVWNFKPYFLYDLYYIASFVISMITTILCYRAVLKVVRQRLVLRIARMTTQCEDDDINLNKFKLQEIKAHRVAFAVVASFLICWGPHVVITIIQMIIPKSTEIDMIQAVGLALAFLSPIAHSLIYSYEARNNESDITIYGTIMNMRKQLFVESTVQDQLCTTEVTQV